MNRDDFRNLQDPALEPIADKVVAGERLSRDDGVALLASDDLLGVGRLANHSYRPERRSASRSTTQPASVRR